ncbi:hypothetical protein FA95DRAFT_1015935 [Auriscalpium vulgare]|uniref:Uncharacterized protein n=1 Tax=Auriscalpium vulgare TaxID=40419 RepID=A0ACB8RX82_9AGAM|nr:hypothetical protein FA95DRAFT_1015935 [Auriscalpium vulgare]
MWTSSDLQGLNLTDYIENLHMRIVYVGRYLQLYAAEIVHLRALISQKRIMIPPHLTASLKVHGVVHRDIKPRNIFIIALGLLSPSRQLRPRCPNSTSS